jgi:hypothetical protein
MSARLTDRDMLARTMRMIDGDYCCDFFACPGPRARPVQMASCAKATAAYELRNYLERHGGWCPVHGQDLTECGGNAPRGCNPVRRTARNKKITED